MPVIRIETRIRAPLEKCFDLARSVDVHVASTSRTRERVVGGVTRGLLGPDDVVTWEATHFCIRQRLTARVTRFDRPRLFEDVMIQGVFGFFSHVHEFQPEGDVTVMLDTFRYQSPLGLLGILVDHLFLQRYMTAFLTERAQFLKGVAELDP